MYITKVLSHSGIAAEVIFELLRGKCMMKIAYSIQALLQ